MVSKSNKKTTTKIAFNFTKMKTGSGLDTPKNVYLLTFYNLQSVKFFFFSQKC